MSNWCWKDWAIYLSLFAAVVVLSLDQGIKFGTTPVQADTGAFHEMVRSLQAYLRGNLPPDFQIDLGPENVITGPKRPSS